MIPQAKWLILKLLRLLFLWRHPHVSIGAHTYGLPRVLFGPKEGTKLKIGKYCSLPHKKVTVLLGGEHVQGWVSTYPFDVEFADQTLPSVLRSKGDVEIGSDVWFGIDCTILSGVKIGHGAIIAANALVTKDVPAYAVAAGTPARVLRYRFSREQIDALLRIQWWNWNDDRVKQAAPLIMQPDVEAFVRKYSSHEADASCQ